jgi:hypothetical protein
MGRELDNEGASFKTQAEAIEYLETRLGSNKMKSVRWLIIAQEDGKFTPAVIIHGKDSADLMGSGIPAIWSGGRNADNLAK